MCRRCLRVIRGVVLAVAGFALALCACLDYLTPGWTVVGVVVMLVGLMMWAKARTDMEESP